ncbi:hypothetical protein DR60_4353 [Burkholderia pseudomallei]|nr:hypothetical protein DR60_4353 [Burkholderia pseudomallei]
MWFRLAKELGMSVRRTQAEISSAEFGEWIAYFSIEPFGERIADLRAGTIASVIANVNRTPNTPPLLPSQFMPWIAPTKAVEKARSAEDIAASVFGVNLAELKKNGTRKIVLRRQPGRTG